MLGTPGAELGAHKILGRVFEFLNHRRKFFARILKILNHSKKRFQIPGFRPKIPALKHRAEFETRLPGGPRVSLYFERFLMHLGRTWCDDRRTWCDHLLASIIKQRNRQLRRRAKSHFSQNYDPCTDIITRNAPDCKFAPNLPRR